MKILFSGRNEVVNITKEYIRQYQRDNPVYYPTVPTLKTKCPVNYDCDACSSKEYNMRCRTCANYNPLRMLYELHNQKEKIQLSVPMEVILDDAKIQLEHPSR